MINVSCKYTKWNRDLHLRYRPSLFGLDDWILTKFFTAFFIERDEKREFFLAGKRREMMGPFCSPLTGSQSERRNRFNLLAHGFSHTINATQGFIWKEIAWPPGLLERKNNNKVVSFSTLLLMLTLTWITEKELERGRRIS